MGYASPAVAIYSADPSFNVVDTYYRLVPFETVDQSWTLPVAKTVRVPNLSFESLLDTIATESANYEMFVIVAHGIARTGGAVWRLGMPLTSNTSVGTRDDVIQALLDFKNKNSSEKDMAEYEERQYFTQENVKGKAHLPMGSVSRLVGKINNLQKKKVRWVCIRACALATNPSFMRNLGLCFGARFINAPNVHMFYSGIMHVPKKEAKSQFDYMNKKRHMHARIFNNSGGDQLAIEIIGTGPDRKHWLMRTASDLKWFMDAFFDKGHRYMPGGQFFQIAGMDDAKLRFALPAEAEYAAHLVWSDPLPVSW